MAGTLPIFPVSAAHRRRSRAFSLLRAWLTARDVT
jgi:hypothetical protein